MALNLNIDQQQLIDDYLNPDSEYYKSLNLPGPQVDPMLTAAQSILSSDPLQLEAPVTYESGKPIKNLVNNLFLGTKQALGMAPTYRGNDDLRKMDVYRRGVAEDYVDRSRADNLREDLMKQFPNQRLTIRNLSGEALEKLVTEIQGPVQTDNLGRQSQTNLLTQAQTNLFEPDSDRMQYQRYVNQYRLNANPGDRLLSQQEFEARGRGLDKQAEGQATENVTSDNYFKKLRRERTGGFTTSIYNAGISASNALPNLYNLQSLIKDDKTDQGYFAPPRMMIREALSDLGFALEGDQAEEAMFKVLSNKLAIAGRDTSEGAGMPGSMSDSDRSFLVEMVPRLGNSQQANALIIKMMVLLEERKIEMRQEQDRFYKEKNTFDGIEDHILNTFRDRDMFTQIQREAEEMLRPKGTTANKVTDDDGEG
tara:strand:- start:215 stop:1486 length:1272 start_codon:yes stop_codon:yes gene_type:complete